MFNPSASGGPGLLLYEKNAPVTVSNVTKPNNEKKPIFASLKTDLP